MNETAIILSTLAICFSGIALIMGCIAISICVGLKNSTHTIQWKTLDNPFTNDPDPLSEEADELIKENPLRVKKKKPEPEDFPFMDDIADQSNF